MSNLADQKKRLVEQWGELNLFHNQNLAWEATIKGDEAWKAILPIARVVVTQMRELERINVYDIEEDRVMF